MGIPLLLDRVAFGGLIADKAYDSNTIIADLNVRGVKVVISQHQRRSKPLSLDRELYKWRHLIKSFFCKLREFKRIAMRADKADQSFKAMIDLAAAVINSRKNLDRTHAGLRQLGLSGEGASSTFGRITLPTRASIACVVTLPRMSLRPVMIH